MIGRRVGHYEILGNLGQGGMGEVYLAEDTSLGRQVAVKFLPDALGGDTLARKRFLREARSAAALDHPYICRIFEVGRTEEGRDFIAMEYVEGETLQSRLAGGPLSLKESLRLSAELSEALASAHARKIIHRDLKPANIMITPSSHPKVMDFGLAKKLVSEDGREQDLSSALTSQGATLGTLAYMSPEQIRGEAVDARSDVFSLGIVLYEMVTGKHPFRRTQAAETTSAILTEDPAPLGRFVDDLPELMRHTVEKMLEKAPAERFQSVHEVLTNLNRLKEDTGRVRLAAGQAVVTPTWVRTTLALAGALIVALAALSIWALWSRPRSGINSAPVVRSSINLPKGERLASAYRHSVAVSPDGRWLAYGSRDYNKLEGSVVVGERIINLRRLDQTDVRRIPGFNPFFSPDSHQLGFVEPAGPGRFDLKRTPVEGGPVEKVTGFEDPDEGGGFGLAWLPGGEIVFAPREGDGLYIVSEVGGDPRPLTQPEVAAGEVGHRLPSVLPDGRSILYTELRYDHFDWTHARIVALQLDSKQKKVLIEGGSDGRYVASGHLVFAREGRLMAAPFDASRLEARGDPVPVLDGLAHSIHSGSSSFETGAAQFGVSRDGLLVFGAGSVLASPPKELVRVDREGHEELLAVEAKPWFSARFSPDERQVLLAAGSSGATSVWLFDLERGALRRQSFDGQGAYAIWGPGPGEFTFRSNPDGPQAIYVKSIDSGPGPGEKLSTGVPTFSYPSSWHPDGRRLAFVAVSAESGTDIWVLDRQSGTEPFLKSRFNEKWPEFSPDGRWLAYTSDESGRNEVYVRPFPGPGKAVQISTTEGLEPCWSRDGSEIFYYSLVLYDPLLNQQPYFAVRIDVSEDELRAGPPKRLFAGRYQALDPVRSFDVGTDGRFLLIKRESDPRTRVLDTLAPSRIELVQNWFEELRAKVPVE